MAKKIKNVLTVKKPALPGVVYGQFLPINDQIEIVDYTNFTPKILVNLRSGMLDIKTTKAPFTNKVKRLARNKKKL